MEKLHNSLSVPEMAEIKDWAARLETIEVVDSR